MVPSCRTVALWKKLSAVVPLVNTIKLPLKFVKNTSVVNRDQNMFSRNWHEQVHVQWPSVLHIKQCEIL